MDILETKDIMASEGCSESTVEKWAAANGVRFVGQGYHKNYIWTQDDLSRFRERPAPGRRWPKKEGGDNANNRD